MAPLASDVMNQLLMSCQSEDGLVELRGAGDSFAHVGRSAEGDSDDDDDGDLRGLTVRTAWLDEKSSAISAVAALADGAFHVIVASVRAHVGSLNSRARACFDPGCPWNVPL
jgi:hypothetical protein